MTENNPPAPQERTAPNKTNTVSDAEIRRILQVAQTELHILLERRSTVLRRITSVRRTISALMNAYGVLSSQVETSTSNKEDARQKGLTDACRTIVAESNQELTAEEVTQKVRENDPAAFRNHKNPVSSVATILRRLEAYGEAEPKMNRVGRRAWIRVLSATPQVQDPETD
jgi:preprotein translocase subunit SecD